MSSDLKTRRTSTASGATAVQVVRYTHGKREIVAHIGSAHSPEDLEILNERAARYIADHCMQLSLFSEEDPRDDEGLHIFNRIKYIAVYHSYARDFLRQCFTICGLEFLPDLYQDLAIMRIIEPVSKLRSLTLLERYFGIVYAERTMYRALPKLVTYRSRIESAAIDTANSQFDESLSLVLYDVTTLYFESFKEYDLQKPGYSKDNKHVQPQIVVGLITTRSGFPLMIEVFEGNTFEGHTMLPILQRFARASPHSKPVIVADAAMLSRTNMEILDAQGYHYIVGARLANTAAAFIDRVAADLARVDGLTKRYETRSGDVKTNTICSFSEKRFKKDLREFKKQIKRAEDLLERKEFGRRAKFIKKMPNKKDAFEFDEKLRTKTEKLLGIKGYVTNIPEGILNNSGVIDYYHDLWNVEQAFRMSKSDLRARPIFHFTEDSIRAHVLICFVALMVGKLLENKTGKSLRRIRDMIWSVQTVHARDSKTGKVGILTPDVKNPEIEALETLMASLSPH